MTGADARTLPAPAFIPGDSRGLYSHISTTYDDTYAAPTHRRAYDLLAGELFESAIPQPRATIVDAGCGTGRMARKWLAMGHRVIGIEQSDGMIARLEADPPGPDFTLLTTSMDEAPIAPGSVDVVAAFGSVQYTHDPAASLARFAQWLRPGGIACVYVDSLVALVAELMRGDREADAMTILATRNGTFRSGGHAASLAMFTADTIRHALASAGLVDITVKGLVIGASFWGRDGVAERMAANEGNALATERRLTDDASLADLGLHLFAVGRKP